MVASLVTLLANVATVILVNIIIKAIQDGIVCCNGERDSHIGTSLEPCTESAERSQQAAQFLKIVPVCFMQVVGHKVNVLFTEYAIIGLEL
jgi:hypothetical protein